MRKVMAVDMLVAILLIVLYLFLGHWYRNQNSGVKVWPIVGLLPALVSNAEGILYFFTDMRKFYGGAFKFKGLWFPSLDFVITHPMNIQPNFTKKP